MLEAALALCRADKFDLGLEVVRPILLQSLTERGIVIVDLPPAEIATILALGAAERYRAGRPGLNLGDCLHYAVARHHHMPILATSEEFSRTDLRPLS